MLSRILSRLARGVMAEDFLLAFKADLPADILSRQRAHCFLSFLRARDWRVVVVEKRVDARGRQDFGPADRLQVVVRIDLALKTLMMWPRC